MASMVMSLSSVRAVPASFRAQARRSQAQRFRLRVDAITLWQLKPQSEAAVKNHDLINLLRVDDGSAEKQTRVVGTDTPSIDDFLHDKGFHVVFEAGGVSGALDHPGDLFITDESSEKPVTVDGSPLEKGKQVKLTPGVVLKFGDEAEYQVVRDVAARA